MRYHPGMYLAVEDAVAALILSGYNLRNQKKVMNAWKILLLDLKLVE